MIHPLSRATTYVETYAIRAGDGQRIMRGYATGFFVRTEQALLLVTNWHVVTGLDPENPSVMSLSALPPSFIKLTMRSKSEWLTELTVPLYGREGRPLWEEHPEGPAVDMVIYPLSLTLESYFVLVDIRAAVGGSEIDETVSKDVFILGYPFSKDEMRLGFGTDAPYYFPVWKRGSIATEPDVRLTGRILLIDSLTRPGMSGAPVLIAEDETLIRIGSAENAAIFEQRQRGEMSALDALCALDTKSLSSMTEKRFRFLGVYSGVIGNTRLQQVALGKCWHIDALRELIANSRAGVMPYHSPVPNPHYDAFFDELAGGELIRKDVTGTIVERVPLAR